MPVLERDVKAPARGADGASDWAAGLPPVPPRPWDDEGGPRFGPGGPAFSNARLGMLMLLAGETMFFGGLVAAFLQLRLSAPVWPPAGQPRLPAGLTALNTAVLLASSYAFARALRAIRADDRRGLTRWLGWTGVLGATFLAVQGVEWGRLVHFGLTVSSGIYGAVFYTLVGIHGVHVLGAVAWLLVALRMAQVGRYRRGAHVSLSCCAMYWHFVVTLWPVLYFLVYLA
jgi:heme/copper-type cytochrome/quinol oxidase subunit 3